LVPNGSVDQIDRDQPARYRRRDTNQQKTYITIWTTPAQAAKGVILLIPMVDKLLSSSLSADH
jgi:hypothetical protein